jgi:hypothetical protein
MPPLPILPPEIWYIIYDLCIRSSVDIHEHCTSINFPEVILHLRSPRNHPSVSLKWVRYLRLVCRASKALLDSYPRLALPMSENVVCINPTPDAQARFVSLLSDPLKCCRVSVLDLSGSKSSNSSTPTLFDILCDKACYLPSLRTLTIGFTLCGGRDPVIPRFWGRLNEAFPNLECLVARGGVATTWEDSTVTFKTLRVIDMDFLYADHQVWFPALLHAAFGVMNYFKAANFTGCQYLQSLLLRSITDPEQFDWDFVPKLQLLGVPSGKVNSLPPLPQWHPLHHIYLYVDIVPRTNAPRWYRLQEASTWLAQLVERLPTISRITMAFEPTSKGTMNSILGDFNDDEVHRLGFAAERVSSRCADAAPHVVMKRVTGNDRVPSMTEETSGSRTFERNSTGNYRPPSHSLQSGLKALRRLSSLRLGG